MSTELTEYEQLDYYASILELETKRMLEIVEEWDTYKDTEEAT